MNTNKLIKHLHANFPVESVHFKDTPRESWHLTFKPEATEEQRVAANEALLNFDISDDPVELRAERYKQEADPFIMQAYGYSLELEREQNEAKRASITTKRETAIDAYIAAKAKIRNEIR